MDFLLPAVDDVRRLEVRAWLADHPSPSGAQLAEAGYVAPHWPKPWGLDADPIHQIVIDDELRRAIDQIAAGEFADGDPSLFQPIVNSLLDRDEYLVLADYRAYVDCQAQIDRAFRDEEAWTRSSILNAARCGFFSSDRSMRDYIAARLRFSRERPAA